MVFDVKLIACSWIKYLLFNGTDVHEHIMALALTVVLCPWNRIVLDKLYFKTLIEQFSIKLSNILFNFSESKNLSFEDYFKNYSVAYDFAVHHTTYETLLLVFHLNGDLMMNPQNGEVVGQNHSGTCPNSAEKSKPFKIPETTGDKKTALITQSDKNENMGGLEAVVENGGDASPAGQVLNQAKEEVVGYDDIVHSIANEDPHLCSKPSSHASKASSNAETDNDQSACSPSCHEQYSADLPDNANELLMQSLDTQQKLYQHASQLLQRLRRLQCHQFTKHLQNQLSGLTSHVHPVSTFSSAENNMAGSTNASGSSKAASAVPRQVLSTTRTSEDLNLELNQFSDHTLMCMRHLNQGLDTDLTDSSSGGESCDEEEESSWPESSANTFRRQRAENQWHKDRARLASRWTWLQTQVSDLEYRIRQQNQLYVNLRHHKGQISLLDGASADSNVEQSHEPGNSVAVTTSQDSLLDRTSNLGNTPPHTCSTDCRLCSTNASQDSSAARCRPLNLQAFVKRKIVRTFHMHLRQRKLASKCRCIPPNCCVMCNKGIGYIEPPNPETMPVSERIALLDHSYHQVLSFKEDASLSVRLGGVWRNACTQRSALRHNTKQPEVNKRRVTLKIGDVRKHTRLRKNASAAVVYSNKIKNKYGSAQSQVSVPRKSLLGFRKRSDLFKNHKQKNRSVIKSSDLSASRDSLRRRRPDASSFDIDNIVIPLSIAASTRVEKLQYKEIDTPSWRVIGDTNHKKLASPSNFFVPNQDDSLTNEEEHEDVSESAFVQRHLVCEQEEHKHFMVGHKNTASRRRNSRLDSESAAGPDARLHSTGDEEVDWFNDVTSRRRTASSSSELSHLHHPPVNSHYNRTLSVSTGLTEGSTRQQLHWPKRTFPLKPELATKLTGYEPTEEDLQIIKTSRPPALASPRLGPTYNLRHDFSPLSPSNSSDSTIDDEDPQDGDYDPRWKVQKLNSKTLVLKIAKK